MSKTFVDMWYGDEFVSKKYYADCFFSDLDFQYRGNIYDETGKIIGDYATNKASWVQEKFNISFD